MKRTLSISLLSALLALSSVAWAQDVKSDVDTAAKDTGHATKKAATKTAGATKDASVKNAARAEGLQPQQYELLLAVSGLPKEKQPTIKEIAAQLCLEHHTVVELADRLEKQGLLVRRSSPLDKRVALLQVTRSGQGVLGGIVGFSFAQLRDEAPLLITRLRRILKMPTGS